MSAGIPEFAIRWASELGANPKELTRLQGGINNQVFQCGKADQQWVIKGYEHPKVGERDRMQAEVQFLRFAAEAAPGFTPSLIEVDQCGRCVVLEHIEGAGFTEGIPASDSDVADAVEFFRQLNIMPTIARKYVQMSAAEGFLSLKEHLQNVQERVKRMTCIHIPEELQAQAKEILEKLCIEVDLTETRTERLISGGVVSNSIDSDDCCVSPSDFGFHNAIKTKDGIRFIDFEFAGWDDPAKAVEDFILQPQVPVSRAISPLLEGLPRKRRTDIQQRVIAMKPILRLKWVCIIMSVMQPSRFEQIRKFMTNQEAQMLVQRRLGSANNYLGRI